MDIWQHNTFLHTHMSRFFFLYSFGVLTSILKIETNLNLIINVVVFFLQFLLLQIENKKIKIKEEKKI